MQEVSRRTFLAGVGAGVTVAATATLPSVSGATTPKRGKGGSAPKVGGQLVYGLDGEAASVDPGNPQGRTSVMYYRCFYDPLVVLATDGTMRPYLAQSVTPNADFTAWTIKVRPNINFHDGTPCDAQAVKTSLDYLKAQPVLGYTMTSVTSTVVVDSATVTVNLSSPWQEFPASCLLNIFVISPRSIAAGTVGKQPVGTGPFIFQNWEQGDHLTVTRNPNYWQAGLPYLDQITFRVLTDETARVSALLSGGIDVGQDFTVQDILTLGKHSGIKVITDKGSANPAMDMVILNCAVAPFDDVRMRRALAFATDAQRFNQLANAGVPPLMNGFFLPKSPVYTANTGYPTFNLAQAKKLASSYIKDHGPVTMTLGSASGSAFTDPLQILQSMWQKIPGLKVQIEEVEASVFSFEDVEAKFSAVYNNNISTGGTSPDNWYLLWSPTTLAAVGVPTPNISRFSNPTLSKEVALARTVSGHEQIAAYQAISKLYGQQCPYIFLGQCLDTLAYNGNSFRGFTPTFEGHTLPPVAPVAPAWLTQVSAV